LDPDPVAIQPKMLELDPDPYEMNADPQPCPHQLKIRIRIRIKSDKLDQNDKPKLRNMSLFGHFFKGLSLYLEPVSDISFIS
jgi:hypothetical protein